MNLKVYNASGYNAAAAQQSECVMNIHSSSVFWKWKGCCQVDTHSWRETTHL